MSGAAPPASLPLGAALLGGGVGRMLTNERTEASVAKEKKGKEKKGKKEESAHNGPVDVAVEEREPEAPETWVGHHVKLRHPVNLNSSFAVGSSAGLLEEAGERGVVLLKRDQRYFYPWSSVFFISLDERAESSA